MIMIQIFLQNCSKIVTNQSHLTDLSTILIFKQKTMIMICFTQYQDSTIQNKLQHQIIDR
jgi:hypothetical protein